MLPLATTTAAALTRHTQPPAAATAAADQRRDSHSHPPDASASDASHPEYEPYAAQQIPPTTRAPPNQPNNQQHQQPNNQQYNAQYQQPYNQQNQQPYNPQYQQPYNGQYQQPYNQQPYKQPGPGQPPQYAPYQPPPAAYVVPVSQPAEPTWWGGNGTTNPEIPDDKLITPDLDIKIRHAFIRKVYGLLSVMLTITFGLALMFNLWDSASNWILRNPWLPLVLMIIAFIAIIVLTCVPTVARTHPMNVIILGFIALAFGVILGFSSARVSTYAFALAAGITAAVTLSLTIFAIQTKWDFTGCGVFVLVSVVVLVIMGIVMIFVRNKIAHIVYASIGALLFSFYMVYDTQQIVGGKHRKFQYSIDDYVFAALTLFMDVINLFMYILSIISLASD